MNSLLKITAFTGAIAVGLGAFAAHGLKPLMDAGQIETFKTGSTYHFVHLLAMFSIAILSKNDKILTRSFYFFLSGIILFSGSLYLLSTKHLFGGDNWNFIGPITPIGGLFFICGWVNLIFSKKQV